MMQVYRNFSEALHHDGQTAQARLASLKALAIAQRTRNSTAEASIWGELGDVCASENRYPESLHWYRKYATAIGGGLEKLKGNEWMHAVHALASLERAAELLRLYKHRIEGNDVQGHVMHSNRRALAYAYMQTGKPRDAINIVEQNVHTEEEDANSDGLGFDFIPLVMAYSYAGDTAKSSELVNKGQRWYKFATTLGLKEGVMALNAANSHNYAAARKYIDEALDIDYHYKDPGSRKDREAIFQGIRWLPMARDAARIIHDGKRQKDVDDRINELKAELRSGGFF